MELKEPIHKAIYMNTLMLLTDLKRRYKQNNLWLYHRVSKKYLLYCLIFFGFLFLNVKCLLQYHVKVIAIGIEIILLYSG